MVFSGDRPLPILAVDEPIYRRLPAFLIATVDKFASLPWEARTGVLLGGADRYDRGGFLGAAEPRAGRRLERPLPPPDLVIQDELHLISGPLGTMVGLYESVIDALCVRAAGDRAVRPKIVASTATARQARDQIQALFARSVTHVFPPPGPDRRDSFFARTLPVDRAAGRRYLGIASPGRNPKVLMRRVWLALMGAAERAYRDAGGHANRDNPADPYMTVLGYFNSLRELGGARRILEEEVRNTLRQYGQRRRSGEPHGLFRDRRTFSDVVELTSRVSTDRVADARRRLERAFHETDRSVEVSSVTPFSARALDRGLAGALVGLARHAEAKLTPPAGVERLAEVRAGLEGGLLDSFGERVERQPFAGDAERSERLASVRRRVVDLLDSWRAVVEDYHAGNVAVKYQQYEMRQGRPLLRGMLDTEFESEHHRKFRAHRSLRDVEPEVDLYIREPTGRDVVPRRRAANRVTRAGTAGPRARRPAPAAGRRAANRATAPGVWCTARRWTRGDASSACRWCPPVSCAPVRRATWTISTGEVSSMAPATRAAGSSGWTNAAPRATWPISSYAASAGRPGRSTRPRSSTGIRSALAGAPVPGWAATRTKTATSGAAC